MPKKMEEALRKQARKKRMPKERADAFVYGSMRKTGWKPSHQKKKTVARKKK